MCVVHIQDTDDQRKLFRTEYIALSFFFSPAIVRLVCITLYGMFPRCRAPTAAAPYESKWPTIVRAATAENSYHDFPFPVRLLFLRYRHICI